MPGLLRDGSWIGRTCAFLRQNREQLVVDGAILLTWIVASASLFRWLALPQWLYTLVLFVGVAVYSKLTLDWERPDRDRDRSHR